VKGLFIVLGLAAILAWSVDCAEAGTLDRGVHISSFFIAGGAYGNPLIAQLKYQMAIDTRLGLKSRYTNVTNSYNTYTNCSFDTNNTGTFNTFDSEVSGGSVTINNTTHNTP
jgi:hypothetical protein